MDEKRTAGRSDKRAPMSEVRGGSEDDERLDVDEDGQSQRGQGRREAEQSGTRASPGKPARG